MPPTRINGLQVRDGSVQRVDLDTTTSGQAVVARVAVNASYLSMSSTGADAGTGDVTFSLVDSGVTIGEYQVVTVDVKGRVTGGRALAATDLPTTGIGTGTGTKFTYDNYGRITAVSSLAAGDIPSGSTYYVQNQSGSAQSADGWVTGFLGAQSLRSYNAGNTLYTELVAPAGLAANRSFSLPATYGSNGDALIGNGAGVLSWTNLSSTYVPIAGATEVTGQKTFSAGVIAASLQVTGAFTLGTVTGVLRADTGTVSTQAVGNLTETGSSVLSITGGTGSVLGSGSTIQVTQATTSTAGYLSSADWNTFNNKQNAITDPVTGTGTASYVARWSSGTAITGDIGLSTVQSSGKTFALVLGGTASNPPNASMGMYINGQAGYAKELVLQTAGARRWTFTVTNGAESGSDAGSALRIIAYIDGGTQLDFPLEITRASAGAIALGGSTLRPVNLSGALTVGGTFSVTGTSTFTGKAAFPASVSGSASLSIAAGTTPSAPTSGDVWNDGTYLWFRNNAGNCTIVHTSVSLTTNTLPKASAAGNLANSNISDNGSLVTVSSALTVTGVTTLATSLGGILFATAGVVSVAAASDITGTLLTGFSVGTNATIAATDSILSAFGKTQAQINAMTNFWSRASSTVSLVTATDRVNIGTPGSALGKLNIAGGSVHASLDTNYRVLLHFDGANRSRRIIDSGSYFYQVYARGTQYYNPPTLSNAQSKFGNTSLLLDGTDYLEVSSRTTIGTADFTLDFHVRFSSVSGTQTLVDWGGSASGLVLSYSAGVWTLNVAGTAVTFSQTPATSTWYHIAVSRTSGSVRFWVSGTKTGTTQTASASVTATNTSNMFIGATSAGANRVSAHIDEFRFLTGTSAYTSDSAITVPTSAYDAGGVRVSTGTTDYVPDSYVLTFDGQGSAVPSRPPRTQLVTFCLGESVANTTKYFYAQRGLGTTQEDAQRSGNGSGMSYANACSPAFAGFNGRITSAILTVQGVGVNNGSVTAPVVYRTDLFRVGFAAEHDPNINGGAAVQLDFSLPSTATIGTYSVGATNSRVELQGLSIAVTSGDPLALKFVNGSGASGAALTQMAFVTLVIEETF